MIIEVKDNFYISSIETIKEKFSSIEPFAEHELEDAIVSQEPQDIINTVAKKAARVDKRYFVLLKTNESLLALHLGLNYFLLITEDKKKRIEVCLGRENAEARYVDYVTKVAITWDVSKKHFLDENAIIDYEYCQRVAVKLKDHGFEIEIIHTK